MGVDLDKLTAPFPKSAIKERQGGGGRMLSYVEGHTVIHRLNEATGNCWDMHVQSIETRATPAGNLMIAHVQLTIPGHGTREGLGVQLVNERGGEDLVKGCITDGLKKAATLFGVGLELYGPDYEAGEVAPARQPAPMRQTQQPPRQPVPVNVQPGGGVMKDLSPRPQAGPGQITDKQVKYLFGLASEVNPDKDVSTEDFLHGQMAARFGVANVHELTKQQASQLVDWFKARDFIDAAPPPTPAALLEDDVPEEPEWLRNQTWQ